MKRCFCLFSFLLGVISFLSFSNIMFAQASLLLEENFDYSPGTNLESNGWTVKTGSSSSIVVETIGLNYNNYGSSSGGSIKIDANGYCYYKSIGSIITSGSIYVSLLLNVSDAYEGVNNYYVFSLGSSTASAFGGRLFIKKNGSNLAFGLSKAADIPIYTSYSYNFNTTYLIVIKYSIVSNSQNDNAYLYVIDGDIPADDSSPTLSVISNTSNDPTNIEVVYLRQGVTSTVVTIDGIRVSTGWSQAPLPVELASFTAKTFDTFVKLNWQTATEVNNYGFEIERLQDCKITRLQDWVKIGFVKGGGNSNSSREYNFVDKNVSSGKYFYRLKQIDNNSSFKYSKEIEVEVAKPMAFKLHQNYPNPFNPSTTIQFTIPEDSHVVLKLYDVLGREIQTILNERRKAGTHTVNFIADDLSNGVYLYKLTAGNYSGLRKMILLK